MNAQNQVYQYNTSTQSWVNIPGAALDEVWATFDGAVWGVDIAGKLYQLNAGSFTLSFTGISTGVVNVVAGNAVSVWAYNPKNGAVFAWF